jgi:RNA polymerase sigma-70 factor (ECF subfamily)
LLPRLWRFALRLTRDPADAEVLVERSCLQALGQRSQWRPGSAMLTWLFAIMYNAWINELRERQLRHISSLEADDERAAPMLLAHRDDPSQSVLSEEIVDAVQLLPEDQRVVVLLVAVEGLSYGEAAEVLDVPIGMVMSRWSLARKVLEQRLVSEAVGN